MKTEVSGSIGTDAGSRGGVEWMTWMITTKFYTGRPNHDRMPVLYTSIYEEFESV